MKYKRKLYLDEFESINSKSNDFLQITDLFTSSINRVLNVKSNDLKPKDEFASNFLKTFGIKIENDVLIPISDITAKFEM